MEKLGVTLSLTFRYHQQANGQVERVNQEGGKFLRTFYAELELTLGLICIEHNPISLYAGISASPFSVKC